MEIKGKYTMKLTLEDMTLDVVFIGRRDRVDGNIEVLCYEEFGPKNDTFWCNINETSLSEEDVINLSYMR